ncbi:MAG: hypothetical protein ACOCUI_02870 [bacterium]
MNIIKKLFTKKLKTIEDIQNYSNILEKVRDVISKELLMSKLTIYLNDRLEKDLKISKLDKRSIILKLRNIYDISIPYKRKYTIEDLVNLIYKKVN